MGMAKVGKHLLDVGRAAATAVSRRRGRLHRDLIQRTGSVADRALDRLVLDVVAPADGFEAADGRVQRFFRVIHSGRG